MITRRQVVVGAVSLVIGSRAAAQSRNYRVGILGYAALSGKPFRQAFLTGLGELGYREGQNLIVESRYVEGRPDRLPAMAMELIDRGVEVIVLGGELAAKAVKAAKPTIPIVMVWSLDPVGEGLAASLARPGGNVTGLTFNTGPEQAAKELQIFKEALPSISRIALIWDPASLGQPAYWRRVNAAAKALSIEMYSVEVRTASDVMPALESIRRSRPSAFWLWGSPIINPHRKEIFEFAIKERIPAFGVPTIDVEQGCLMAYSVNILDLYRRAPGFVDRILKGANPGDLPIEQPTRFELVINLKTAKALGLKLPQSILLAADRVIE